MDGIDTQEHLEAIPLERIDPSPTNPRKRFDPTKLQELADSIRSKGLISPVVVRPITGTRYELVVGERRYRASKLADCPTILALVRTLTDREVCELQLEENGQREDVHPLEEAIALDKLVRNHKRTPEYLADRLGHSVQWVRRRLALLGLTEDARAWLQHRSGLRDTVKAPLHKQWLPDGDDRVAHVGRGADVVSQVLDYCREHKVPLRLNGADLLAPEAPAKAPKVSRSSKGATAPKPPATAPDEASAPEDDSRFDPLRGTVLVFRDDDYWGRNGKKGVGSDRSLSASKGGIGSTCGGDLRPFTIVGPVRPGDARIEAAMAAATKAGVSFLALDDVDTSEARALAEKPDAAWTVAKPAKTPNKPVAPTAPAPRVERVADDVLAVLSTMEVDGTLAKITEGALDRKLYERTNKVLEALGGTWSKKLKVHTFAEDPTAALDGVILTGEVSRARDVLGFFPTPTELVQELLFRADEDGATDSLTLLEPSAGEGAIVGAALKLPYYKVTAVELDVVRHRTLASRYGDLLVENVCGDFLRWDTDERFDRVVMNPPFARQQDLAHVTAAYRLLKPGGRLVAVMSAGVAFREDRKTVAFRELVREAGGTITENPEGSFKSSGTSVRTVTVVMDRKAVST